MVAHHTGEEETIAHSCNTNKECTSLYRVIALQLRDCNEWYTFFAHATTQPQNYAIQSNMWNGFASRHMKHLRKMSSFIALL